ncbi:MAG: glycosyltransferase family 4 protein [Acidobacteriota bacterium]
MTTTWLFGVIVFGTVGAATLILHLMPGVKGATPWMAATAFALSYGLTPAAGWLARRLGVMDFPGGRKIHEKPTPLLGGMAIYVAFAVIVLLNGVFTPEVRGIFIASTLIFAVGAVEDTRGVSAIARLISQVVAVGILVHHGVALTFLPPTWWGVAGEWGLTFLWVVGITNAFNFLDGLDGLAGGSSAINAFFIGVYASATGQTHLAVVSLALMGGALGFLPYNYKPHRRNEIADIFLGDSGSTFLGFALASLTVMADWAEGSPKDLIVPVLIMAVPIFDMVLTTVVRFREGLVKNLLEWILYTGRDHFHHRLLELGIRKKEAVAIIYLVNCCLGISAFLLKGLKTADASLVLGQVTIIFGITGYAMVVMKKRHQRAPSRSEAGSDRSPG